MNKRPTVTLCMIVKDEEAMLGACLDSVRELVTEMVVVDTGSSDRTPAIAREAGARVVEFPWCDDFAAARNAALPHLTTSWILMLDADERLAPGAGEPIRRAIAGGQVDCGFLPLLDADSLDASPEDVLGGGARRILWSLWPQDVQLQLVAIRKMALDHRGEALAHPAVV